jgi:hypothetical protein
MSETAERSPQKRNATERFEQLYSDWLNARPPPETLASLKTRNPGGSGMIGETWPPALS